VNTAAKMFLLPTEPDIEFAPDLPRVEPTVEFVTFAEFVAHPVPQAERS
jgi:hypothetical protein